jgi:hypothetical protein
MVTPEERSLTPTTQSNGSATVLRITDIQPFDKNPRQAANPLFDTIKASIRQRGMDAPLTVTRRPGATHYVVTADVFLRPIPLLAERGIRPLGRGSRRVREDLLRAAQVLSRAGANPRASAA